MHSSDELDVEPRVTVLWVALPPAVDWKAFFGAATRSIRGLTEGFNEVQCQTLNHKPQPRDPEPSALNFPKRRSSAHVAICLAWIVRV